MVKKQDYAKFTRNEFCDTIENFKKEISELNDYVRKLEEVIRIYKNKDAKGELSAMIEDSLICKAELETKDRKIAQLVQESLDTCEDIRLLQAELKRANLAIRQYEAMVFTDKIQIKQIKN